MLFSDSDDEAETKKNHKKDLHSAMRLEQETPRSGMQKVSVSDRSSAMSFSHPYRRTGVEIKKHGPEEEACLYKVV